MARYKVRIEQVFPSTAKDQLKESEECIIGISMGNPIYWRSSLNSVLDWSGNNFSKSILLVGDTLYRWNEIILNPVSLEEAEIHCLKLGDKFIQRLDKYLIDTPKDKYVVIRWSRLVKEEKYKSAIEFFKLAFNNNQKFRSEILSQGKHFVDSLKKRGKTIVISEDEAIKYCSFYLIEELAVFSELMSKSHILIYPGITLPLLASISNGEFADISTSLKTGVYVQLKVQK